MRVLIGLLIVSTVALAQISDVTTNFDGSQLYFGSRLIHPEASTEPHSKIFRWTRETGVRTFLARTREWTTPMPRNGIATNYYDLRYPSVAANGLLSFTGYRDCRCVGLGLPTIAAALLVDSNAGEIRVVEGGVDLRPYRTSLSPNGRFVVFIRNSIRIDQPITSSIILNSEFAGASRDSALAWTIAKRNVITDDAAAVYSAHDFRLAEIGRLQPNGQRGTLEQLLPASVPVMVPMISGNGEVVVYESVYEQGMPRRFFSLDLATGQERLLFTDAETEDYGRPDFFNDYTKSSFVPLPEPMYGASIDYSGRYALVLGREAVDKPRQWLYFAPTDRGEGGGEWFGYVEEGYSEAVLSGDANVIFAVTNSGRLIRIDRNAGITEELLPRTPFVTDISGSARPGSTVRLYGGGFGDATILPETYPATTSLGGVQVEFQGMPMIVTRVSPTDVDFQIPWDLTVPLQSEVEYPLVVKVANQSPLQLAPLKWFYSTSPAVLPPGPVRDDGSPVTLANRLRSYETLRMIVSGLPLPAGVTGMPAAERQPIDFTCRAGDRLAETLYAGPLPGTIGLGEVIVKLPDLTGTQIDAGRRWTTLRCGEPGLGFAVDLPLEKD